MLFDPTTGAPRPAERLLAEDARDARLQRARAAHKQWRKLDVSVRAEAIVAMASALTEQRTQLAQQMTREMGKPLSQALGEVDKCIRLCHFYAEAGPAWLADEPVQASADETWIQHEPLGVVLAIMPWNFPLWQALRFAVPALLAGNGVAIKHAENVPGTARAVEALGVAAGLPSGLLCNLPIAVEHVEGAIAHPAVAAVTVTGSERAGRAVASLAGQHLKKSVLELGGSDPFIVRADANLPAAVEGAVLGRCRNNGQSCCAAKRFLVHERVADKFIAALKAAFDAQVMGDPMDSGTDLGPLARQDLRDQLAAQVDETVAAGATVQTGGAVPDRSGWFYPATLLTDVPLDSPAATQELFGPVAAVFRFSTDDEAVAIANASPYGLTASIWSRDLQTARNMGAELECGGVYLNEVPFSDPRFPFGGVKRSGYGRELGRAGLMEFVNQRVLVVSKA